MTISGSTATQPRSASDGTSTTRCAARGGKARAAGAVLGSCCSLRSRVAGRPPGAPSSDGGPPRCFTTIACLQSQVDVGPGLATRYTLLIYLSGQDPSSSGGSSGAAARSTPAEATASGGGRPKRANAGSKLAAAVAAVAPPCARAAQPLRGGETIFYGDRGRALAAVGPRPGLALLHLHGEDRWGGRGGGALGGGGGDTRRRGGRVVWGSSRNGPFSQTHAAVGSRLGPFPHRALPLSLRAEPFPQSCGAVAPLRPSLLLPAPLDAWSTRERRCSAAPSMYSAATWCLKARDKAVTGEFMKARPLLHGGRSFCCCCGRAHGCDACRWLARAALGLVPGPAIDCARKVSRQHAKLVAVATSLLKQQRRAEGVNLHGRPCRTCQARAGSTHARAVLQTCGSILRFEWPRRRGFTRLPGRVCRT
jgi:hypothetical protein